MPPQSSGSIFDPPTRTPIGPYFPERDQPKLSADQDSLVNQFHDLYYRRWSSGEADTINLSWFGFRVWKCPLDLWIYQELIVRTRPDVVVETGTNQGGSALFMAMIFDHIGQGRVISIDIEDKPDRPKHPRIRYVTGSSTDPKIVGEVRDDVGAGSAMVVLDSDHSAAHVYDEMQAYKSLVPRSGYMIVEDTNVNGHPTFPEFGPGPMEAVERFLSESAEFEIDERCQRFMMTLNPRGYLRRAKSSAARRPNGYVAADAVEIIFHRPTETLSIIDYGPQSSVVGERFNVQPTGQSAIWMRASHVPPPMTYISFDGARLETVIAGTLLTAEVPDLLPTRPGTLLIVLKSESGRPLTQPVEFIVSAGG